MVSDPRAVCRHLVLASGSSRCNASLWHPECGRPCHRALCFAERTRAGCSGGLLQSDQARHGLLFGAVLGGRSSRRSAVALLSRLGRAGWVAAHVRASLQTRGSGPAGGAVQALVPVGGLHLQSSNKALELAPAVWSVHHLARSAAALARWGRKRACSPGRAAPGVVWLRRGGRSSVPSRWAAEDRRRIQDGDSRLPDHHASPPSVPR